MDVTATKLDWDPVTIAVGRAATVPLLGTVAAGLPFHALPVEGELELPPGMWNGRRVFALRVRGASMIDEGIRDGDYLIVESRETADPGQTVVAEVDGEVAASLVGYRLDDPYDLGGLAEMPPVVQPLIKLEARAPGSWYVNVLATFPEFRRLGLATTLLKIAESNANDAGASALSVIVASWNESAERLYRRAGHEVVATEPAIHFPGCSYTGDWVLMVKLLANGA